MTTTEDRTTAATTRFATAVKTSPRGRTWYRADSSSTGNRDVAQMLATLTAADNPALPVALVDADQVHTYRPGTLRMAHDHIYDGTGQDTDTDVDALTDAEL